MRIVRHVCVCGLMVFAMGVVFPCAVQAKGTPRQIKLDETAVQNAQTDLARAKKDYANALTTKRVNFERSSELKDAQLAVASANSEVTKARESVMATLGGDADYQAASKRADEAHAKVEELRSKNASPDQISKASTASLAAGANVSAMERKALDADATYAAAMQKVVDANKKVTKMKSDFETSLTTDGGLKDLKKSQEDGAVNLKKAQDQLAEDKKP